MTATKIILEFDDAFEAEKALRVDEIIDALDNIRSTLREASKYTGGSIIANFKEEQKNYPESSPETNMLDAINGYYYEATKEIQSLLKGG